MCYRLKATNILNVPQLNVSPLKQDKRKEIDFTDSSCDYIGWQGGPAGGNPGRADAAVQV